MVRVVLEALREEHTVNQIAAKQRVHSSLVSQWRKQAREISRAGFSTRGAKPQQENEALIESLYSQIERQKVGFDFLKQSFR